MSKQIFASLEIANHEIRLILGEFFNTRFNILKTERVEYSCILNEGDSQVDKLKIKDKSELTRMIKKVLDNASTNVGATIENVLLCIPSANVVRVPVSVTEKNSEYNGLITRDEVTRTLNKAMNARSDEQHILVSAICAKFTCNGITTRKIPYNKSCDEYSMLIDLYKADRKFTYDLVGCVEAAGCKVLDIALDSYAIAKEMSLFEREMVDNTILIKLEQETTTLAYFIENRLISSRIMDDGYLKWALNFSIQQHIPKNIVASIVLNNAKVHKQGILGEENIVYLWSDNNVKHALNDVQLYEMIKPYFDKWCETISVISAQSTEGKRNRIILTGEGADIEGITSALQEVTGCEVISYVPDTLGVRNPALTGCLGTFFAYKDQHELFENSVNMTQFKKSIGLDEPSSTSQSSKVDTDTGITGKFKNMWFDFTAKKGKGE